MAFIKTDINGIITAKYMKPGVRRKGCFPNNFVFTMAGKPDVSVIGAFYSLDSKRNVKVYAEAFAVHNRIRGDYCDR